MSAGNGDYIDSTGAVRRLGMIPATGEYLKRRLARKSFGDVLREKGLPIIPRASLTDYIVPAEFDPWYVLNQRDSSGCVGWSEAAAAMKTRRRAGMKAERLSGAFTYAHINGGRDSGAYIIDALESGERNGHALESEFDYPKLFLGQIPAGVKETAKERQSLLSFPVDDFDVFWTALKYGFVVQHGVQVDSNFGRFDADGISQAAGDYANHSVHSSGLKIIRGEPRALMGNTWGLWGPWGNGYCFLSERGIILEGDAFVHMDGERLAGDLPTPK